MKGMLVCCGQSDQLILDMPNVPRPDYQTDPVSNFGNGAAVPNKLSSVLRLRIGWHISIYALTEIWNLQNDKLMTEVPKIILGISVSEFESLLVPLSSGKLWFNFGVSLPFSCPMWPLPMIRWERTNLVSYKRVTHILNRLGQHQPCSFLLLYVIDMSFGYVVMSLSLSTRHGGSSVWGAFRSNPFEKILCVTMMSGVNAVDELKRLTQPVKWNEVQLSFINQIFQCLWSCKSTL